MTEKQFTARQKEALDVSKSICVTASAGTGKTTLLAERYVQSLIAEKIMPKNILCLTYTDKAAVEMRDKIEANLRAKYAKEQTEHLKNAIDTFYLANISTFHGFCAKLLREFAFEAEVTPGFGIMDEVAAEELVEATIDDLLEKPPADIYTHLVYLFTCFTKNAVRETIKSILAKWRILEEWYRKFSENPEAAYNETAEKFKNISIKQAHELCNDKRFSSFMEACSQCGYSSKAKKIQDAIKDYHRLKKAETPEEIRSVLLDMKSKDRLSMANLNANHLQDPPFEELDYYNSCLEKLAAEPVLPYTDKRVQYLIRAMTSYCSVVQIISARVEEKKQRMGVLDFDDLIHAARRLITNEGVVKQLRDRFRFILVDEVQDNDPTLTEIIKTLRGDNKDDNRIFIVGDLKQSIYKFRGADPEGAREYFNSFSHSVDLDTCFRSLQPIINSVNTVFKPVFNGSVPGLKYDGVRGKRNESHGSVQVIHHEQRGKTAKDDEMKLQGELLAGWIQHVVESNELRIGNDPYTRPVTYGDIVILQDRDSHLTFLTKGLEAYGVPYRIVKGTEFYASDEVGDFLHLLKTVAYPEDDIALFGVLVSPYFGIHPDILAMYPVENSWDTSTLWERLSESQNPEIVPALEKISQFRTYQSSLSLIGLARRMVQETGVRSVYATMNKGSERISNLDTILDFVSDFSESIFACIERIEKNIMAKAKDETGDDEIAEEDADFVQIMTIHASKGLEFPVVVLSYAGRIMYSKPVYVHADPELGLGLNIKLEDEHIPCYVYAAKNAELTAALLEERKRLFYVAMTRAQDHLVLSEGGCGGEYPSNAFMTYYRNAVDVTSDKVTYDILGEKKDPRYDIFDPQKWDEILPVPCDGKKRDANQRELDEGTCIHAVFEGKDVEQVCEMYGFQGREDEFREKLNHFLNSEMMKNAAESYCEIPVASSALENLRIDRLVKNKDGSYLIIDYKNGYSTEQNPKLMEEYKVKLKKYSECASDTLGMKVPAYLYFIKDEVYRKIC